MKLIKKMDLLPIIAMFGMITSPIIIFDLYQERHFDPGINFLLLFLASAWNAYWMWELIKAALRYYAGQETTVINLTTLIDSDVSDKVNARYVNLDKQTLEGIKKKAQNLDNN
jgi:hypothetical protein